MGALMPYFANLMMKNVTRKIYQDAVFDLKYKDDYAHNTLKGINRTGKMIFAKAVELGVIKIDPTEYTVLPVDQVTVEELEQEIEIPKYLERDELKLFLATIKEKGTILEYLVFLLLSYSGFRVGELVCLKFRDINFDTGEIKIIKTYYNPTNNTVKYKLLPPKTKKSKRIVEVAQIVLNAIDRYRAYQNKFKMRFRNVWHDKDFIFANLFRHHGYPILVKTVENSMRKYLQLAGLNDALTPHSLRHTHTSLLAEAGVSLEQIMDRLGHSNDQITRLVYLHVTRTRKKEASQKFTQLMESP
jgi:integrase